MLPEIVRLDSNDSQFKDKFKIFETDFLFILSQSYPVYYEDDYQIERITNGQAILYLALIDKKLVGVSYVKRNLRRGGTAIFPKNFRGLGIAKKLVQASFEDFPSQYTILNSTNTAMLALMEAVGFHKAVTIEEIRYVTKSEFSQLSNFVFAEEFLLFSRTSVKRGSKRDNLTLMHIGYGRS